MKDQDCTIHYQQEEANDVAGALSMRFSSRLTWSVYSCERFYLVEFDECGVSIDTWQNSHNLYYGETIID